MDPRSLLDRFARRPAPPADLLAALGDLDRLATARPELAPASTGLALALRAAFSEVEPGPAEPIDLEAIARGWADGTPAYRTAPPKFDEARLMTRARSVARTIEGPAAKALLESIRKNRLALPSLARDALAGRPEAIDAAARAAGVVPATLESVLRLALLPALAPRSAALDRARSESAWRRGECPDCGGPPLLAESRGLEQRIHLRCGLCAGDWPGERLRCPACGESGSKKLRYSFVEGEQERYRLAECQTCSYHWKVVATLSPLTAPGLLVAELASFHLDVLAEGRHESNASGDDGRGDIHR